MCACVLGVAVIDGQLRLGRKLGWIVEESDGLGEETVHVSDGPGADGPEPAARRELPEEVVGWVGWVRHYPGGLFPDSGIMQNTHR